MALGPLGGSKRYVSIHRNKTLYLCFYEWIEGKKKMEMKDDCKKILASGNKRTECLFLSVNISAG